MSKPFSLTRRNLLRALGLGALAFGAPRAGRRGASAAAAVPPKRLVLFYGAGSVRTYDADGTARVHWLPRRPGGAPETAPGAYQLADLELGELHRPLDGLRQHLTVIDGLGMVADEIDPDRGGNAHERGFTHALSGANLAQVGGRRFPGGPSIDQYVADWLAKGPDPTDVKSAAIMAAIWAPDAKVDALRTTAGGEVDAAWEPFKTYDELFAGFVAPGLDEAAAARDASEWTAAWDLAKDDYAFVKGRLDKSGRQRLEAHLDLLGSLTKRLNAAACDGVRPVLKEAYDGVFAYRGGDAGSAEAFEGYGRAFEATSGLNLDLAVAALACDRTRVLTFAVPEVAAKAFDLTPEFLAKCGDLVTDPNTKIFDHHSLVHAVNARPGDSNYLGGKTIDGQDALEACARVVKKQCLVEAELFARLLTKMKEVPEADGGTLLDHSVVLWCGQIGYGNHNLDRLPWVVAGGAGGYFKTGRHLVLPPNPKSKLGISHNNLLVSIANAMGLPDQTFGNPEACTGPLEGLR
jgi:hypothetical protein